MNQDLVTRRPRVLDDGAIVMDDDSVRCDACSEPIEGEPFGQGMYLWSRGDEVRSENAPLCESCSTAIGMAALGVIDDGADDELAR